MLIVVTAETLARGSQLHEWQRVAAYWADDRVLHVDPPWEMCKHPTVAVIGSVPSFVQAHTALRESESPSVAAAVLHHGDAWLGFVRDGDWSSAGLNVVSLSDELMERARTVVPTRLLSNAHAVLVGIGSGGSTVALELAKCGVGHLTLIDHDRIEAANVMRHIADLRDLGRFKTRAVRDRIVAKNPHANVETMESDVADPSLDLDHLLGTADVVVVGTDNPVSRRFVNLSCARVGVPGIFAGALPGARAGIITRFIPGISPCYSCVWEGAARPITRADIASSPVDYDTGEVVEAQKAGLHLDVNFIALIAAKLALSVLIRDPRGPADYEQASENNFVWVSQPDGDVFHRGLEVHRLNIERDPECQICFVR